MLIKLGHFPSYATRSANSILNEQKSRIRNIANPQMLSGVGNTVFISSKNPNLFTANDLIMQFYIESAYQRFLHKSDYKLCTKINRI